MRRPALALSLWLTLLGPSWSQERTSTYLRAVQPVVEELTLLEAEARPAATELIDRRDLVAVQRSAAAFSLAFEQLAQSLDGISPTEAAQTYHETLRRLVQVRWARQLLLLDATEQALSLGPGQPSAPESVAPENVTPATDPPRGVSLFFTVQDDRRRRAQELEQETAELRNRLASERERLEGLPDPPAQETVELEPPPSTEEVDKSDPPPPLEAP